MSSPTAPSWTSALSRWDISEAEQLRSQNISPPPAALTAWSTGYTLRVLKVALEKWGCMVPGMAPVSPQDPNHPLVDAQVKDALDKVNVEAAQMIEPLLSAGIRFDKSASEVLMNRWSAMRKSLLAVLNVGHEGPSPAISYDFTRAVDALIPLSPTFQPPDCSAENTSPGSRRPFRSH